MGIYPNTKPAASALYQIPFYRRVRGQRSSRRVALARCTGDGARCVQKTLLLKACSLIMGMMPWAA